MSVLTASFDDIVFEGRNQAYGAYQLRQNYGNHLAGAGGITLGLCALVLAAWLAWPTPPPRTETKNPGIVCSLPEPVTVIEKPIVAPPTPPALPQADSQPVAAQPVATTPTRVVQDNHVTQVPPDVEQLVAVDGPKGPVDPNGPATETVPGSVVGGKGTESAAPATAPAAPFTYVEKMPEFAGGQEALLRYLRSHLRYPSQALREGQEGRVYLSFVVGADGNISDVQVLKGLGYGLDEEALRVVRQMPVWTPGYQAQHAVPVRFTLPITFKIQ